MHLLHDGPLESQTTLILAHGAGAPMDSDFMQHIAAGIGDRGIHVVRFEFPYMQKRRATGKKAPPDRQIVLESTWHKVIDQLSQTTDSIIIGGKSMGGRISSMIADDVNIRGLVCFGYPFHAPGRPEKTRIEHLKTLKVKALIIQGERDALGSRDEIKTYALPKKIQILFLKDGDHSFKPRKSSGVSLETNLNLAIDAAAEFIAAL